VVWASFGCNNQDIQADLLEKLSVARNGEVYPNIAPYPIWQTLTIAEKLALNF